MGARYVGAVPPRSLLAALLLLGCGSTGDAEALEPQKDADVGDAFDSTRDSAPIDDARDVASDATEVGTADVGPVSCSKDGGHSCGGVAGAPGDPRALYVCAAGFWKVDRLCDVCETMPSGVPDRCRSDLVVPKALVDALAPKPYVEASCVPATFAGWPFPASECTYSAGGLTTKVTVANPSSARVAAWIVDASTFIPRLWELRTSSPSTYEQGLVAVAKGVLGQSSRIFPLRGGIIENMGTGYVNYQFLKGVTETCTSGCYCRINSIHRTEWCTYEALLGTKTYDACIASVGSSGLTAAWGDRCLKNHVDAWDKDRNEHFRAKMWSMSSAVTAKCPTSTACSASDVLAAVKATL